MTRLVAIVGRPNVGKSTLFNRLIGKRKAIVNDISGVTRDRLYDFADWNGQEFIVVDTGGYVANSEDIFEKEIKKQVDLAISEADIILFMVDTVVGITHLDEAFARNLRKIDKPVLVVANKTDSFDKINESFEFFKLGFTDIFAISSVNGQGTGELLDKITELLVLQGNEKNDLLRENLPKFAIVGRPNTGKSTLVNNLLGEERNIVSDIPGTTRDSIHTKYNKFGKEFILIDTAGLRKKAKVTEDLEFYSTLRAIQAIEEADVCILIIDAQENIQAQDLSIVDLVEKRKKGLVILLNKWDLIEKEPKKAEDLKKYLLEKIAPFDDVPIITTSALNKVRIFQAIEKAFEVFENKNKKISTSVLNQVMQDAIQKFHPPAVRGMIISIKYVTQIDAPYPIFAFFCNHPDFIKQPYKRYLENRLREAFKFEGVPIKLSFRQK